LITGFGAGAGTGSSWTTCQLAFSGDQQATASLEKSEKVVEEIKDKIMKK
jgi:precorrin-6B methylase 2